ncbi:hypothetical protein Ssi03_75630 [Sphaerisporangium siamense]|uniref:Regulatory protein n=1 Tax=Sphaerisporangium siamense TaxID=795645 RepID=A0A7W7G9J3_9ACTN|nr:hypothetical protein [Sphaerisporangium siamense]MBB4700660.1 hypothetical protein [Sphaerisporangium siamense]GII89573.1 hypothetical protein Ssi03_75630 [Sphaerisporangium siamense]
MRNIPIPVDINKLSFTCVKAPRPRLVNSDTGEIKKDKDGQIVHEVVLLVEDETGRIELVKVGVSGDSPISPGNEVIPVGLVGYVWEIGQRWGISYRAAAFTPAGAGAHA